MLAAIPALLLLTTALPVASGGSLDETAPAAAPSGSAPQPQMLDVCNHAHRAWNGHIAVVARGQAEPTAALRAAVWAATAVIVAVSVAVAGLAQRHHRPSRTGSARWEAGWAGQADGGRAAAGR
jgi:hypothetical protein